MSNPEQVYQLKVTLDDVTPQIWRRLLVAGDTNLLTLHEIIQRAMGWQNYHLHWIMARDWAIAYRVSELADGLLDDFKVTALNNLWPLPDGQSVPFEPFADRVIADSRLEWLSQDQSFVQRLKRSLVERVLIDPMTRFGVLECEYRPNDILGGDYKDLDTLCLTAPSKALLTLFQKSS